MPPARVRALISENRSVAWTCLWHAFVALLLVVGGQVVGDQCSEVFDAPRDGVRVALRSAAEELGAPTGAVLAAAADDHEECALVEGAPEPSEEEPAAAWPWPSAALDGQLRAQDDASAGTWRRAPARRKCARGPPAIAI